MQTLILDPIGGIAGDMFLGALLDLGASRDVVSAGLRSLELPVHAWTEEQTSRRHVGCTRIHFDVPHEHAHRHLPEILERIARSSLPERAKAIASAAFTELAKAEAKVHRIDVDHVHFHEVGAADAILDICGVSLALEDLGLLENESGETRGRVFVTELPAGNGTVHCDHGELPVPVPAVVELCADRFDLIAGRGEGEMVTPTGAALLRAVARTLPDGLSYRPVRVGYGGGTRASSLLRATLVEPAATSTPEPRDPARDEVVLLTTNVDDITGEALAFAVDRLLALGALDVTATPTLMKKGRPATIVQAMVRLDDEDTLAWTLLALTGSLGVRHQRVRRTLRSRRIDTVNTPWGEVRMKVSALPGGDEVHAAPEYEDCAALARANDLSLTQVSEVAIATWQRQQAERDV